MKQSVLEKVIRKVVREELGEILPTLIAECLAERYLKKVVVETRPAARPQKSSSARSLSELLADDTDDQFDEEVPEVLPNKHCGIYHENPMVKQNEGYDRKEMLSRVMGGDMAELFEGTKPTAQGSSSAASLGETQVRFGEEGVPLDALANMTKMDFGRMKQAAALPAANGPAQETADMKMRQLELRRKSLDVPVSQWKG